MTEDVSGLFYLINGILCLFVVEAVRRPTVVSVWIPLRRATLLGLILSVPAFFVHEELNTINEWTSLPECAWVLVASVLVFLISRAHEWATHLADRLFDREFRRAEQRLAAVGQAIQRADSLAEIERLLVDEPLRSLSLASAALFREDGGAFRRSLSAGWDGADAETLAVGAPPLGGRLDRGPFRLDATGADDAPGAKLPDDLARPVLGVPVGNARRCFAVVLYGGHEAGTDLDDSERDLLGGLARDAEIAYGQVESETLRRRIEVLERELGRASGQR